MAPIRLVKGPLLSTLAILILIWVLLPLLPEGWGWGFGVRFKFFFSIIVISGGLFFLLLKAPSLPRVKGQGKALAAIFLFYLSVTGVLVVLGGIFPQFELPGVEGEMSSAMEQGRTLFSDPAVGCYLCHAIAGSGGTRGPDLSRIGEVASNRKAGMTAEDYLRESILVPRAYLVPGYPALMPENLADRLTPEQIDNLIEFLRSLR